MVEAVRTTASTFEIWAIVVVAVFVLAVWLVGISVADNIQARESRRWWQRVHGPDAALDSPEPNLHSPEPNLHSPEPALDSTGSPAVPGQRRGDEGGDETSAPGAGSGAELEPGTAAAGGWHARPTIDGTGDFRRDAAEADWRTDAPTRPDLPAQEAPTGRHAMPAQRTGDADRAERSLAGPDAGHEDDDPESTGCA